MWARAARRQAGDRGQQLVRHPPAGHRDLEQHAEAADNHTTILGNLVDDPELRFTDTGIAAGHRPLA